MHVAQEVGLGAAVDYLEALGMDAVRAHEEEITAYALERLARRRRDDLRADGRGEPRRRGVVLVQGRPPARPRDDPERGGRRDPGGAPLHQLVMRRFGVPATTRALLRLQHEATRSTRSIEALGKAESVFGT